MVPPEDISPEIAAAASSVFTAAEWLGSLWNSSAKATSFEEIEWQCNTWGSGRGAGDWIETALFHIAAAAFDLSTTRSFAGRDELVVNVPLAKFRQVAVALARLGDEAEAWPWFDEDVEGDHFGQIEIAACELGLTAADVADNAALLDALHIE